MSGRQKFLIVQLILTFLVGLTIVASTHAHTAGMRKAAHRATIIRTLCASAKTSPSHSKRQRIFRDPLHFYFYPSVSLHLSRRLAQGRFVISDRPVVRTTNISLGTRARRKHTQSLNRMLDQRHHYGSSAKVCTPYEQSLYSHLLHPTAMQFAPAVHRLHRIGPSILHVLRKCFVPRYTTRPGLRQ